MILQESSSEYHLDFLVLISVLDIAIDSSQFFSGIVPGSMENTECTSHQFNFNPPYIPLILPQPIRPVRRPLSSVSLDGIMDAKNPRVKRVKLLSDEQKEATQQLSSPAQIPHAERKRQWNALHRRLKQPNLPEWASAKTSAQKFYAQLRLQ